MGYHSVRLRRGSVLGFAVLLVAAVMGTVLPTGTRPAVLPAWSLFRKGIPGGEESQRIEFLQKHGWEAELPAISEQEVTIPAEWDETYTGYASLQQAQGFNLEFIHRLCSLGSGGLDSMPWNGSIVSVFGICHTTHKASYKYNFVTCAVIPVLCTFLIALPICIWLG